MKTQPNRIQIVSSPLSVQQFLNEYVYIIWNKDFLSVLVYTQEGKKKEKRTKLFLLEIRFIKCKQISFPVCLKLAVLNFTFGESI